MYVVNIILDDVCLDNVDIYSAKVDAHMWHWRMGHCNLRALQQLADKDQSSVIFNGNIDSRDCEVFSAGKGKNEQSPPV